MIDESTPDPENYANVRHNHLKRHVRTFAPPPLTGRNTLVERAVRWILPWTVRNYPGVRRGMVQLFGSRVTYSAVKGWRTGRRHMSAAYVEVLAHSIRCRAEQGLALAQELDDYAAKRRAEPRRAGGFQIIKDWDGSGLLRDARWRGGRSKSPRRWDVYWIQRWASRSRNT
jgi:hypothetical protein